MHAIVTGWTGLQWYVVVRSLVRLLSLPMQHRPPDPRSLTASDLSKILRETEGLKLEFKLEYDLSGGAGSEQRKGEFAKDILSLVNTAGRNAFDFAYMVIGAGDKIQADGSRLRKSILSGQYTSPLVLDIVNASCAPQIKEMIITEIEVDETLYCVIVLPPSPQIHSFSKNIVTPKRTWQKNAVPLRSGEGVILASPDDLFLMQKQKMASILTDEADDFENIVPLFAKYTPTPLPSGIRAKRAVSQLLAFLNPRPHDAGVVESTKDFLGLLQQYRHIALEGSSGSGKTTTLRQIETSLLKRGTSEFSTYPTSYRH